MSPAGWLRLSLLGGQGDDDCRAQVSQGTCIAL